VFRTQQMRLASSLMGRIALAQRMQPVRDALLNQAGRQVSRVKGKAKTSK